MGFLSRLFGFFEGAKAPKWRLKPDDRGTYSLQMWHPEVCMYLSEAAYVTPDEADDIIAKLESNVLYYRESD